MKFVAVALLAFVAVATSKHVELGNKNLITDIIKAIIDKNRDKLANLTIEKIDLKEFGSVNNLVIVGAENFVLDKLDAAGPLSVDISNATISLATGSASAGLDLHNVEIPEIGVTINGVGELTGTANDMFLTVAIDIKLDGLTPVVEDWSQLYMHVGSIEGQLTGIDNADSVNEILDANLVRFLNENLVLLAEKNKAAIIEAINKILASIV